MVNIGRAGEQFSQQTIFRQKFEHLFGFLRLFGLKCHRYLQALFVLAEILYYFFTGFHVVLVCALYHFVRKFKDHLINYIYI